MEAGSWLKDLYKEEVILAYPREWVFGPQKVSEGKREFATGIVEEPEYLDSSRVTRIARKYFRELAERANLYLLTEGIDDKRGALRFNNIKIRAFSPRSVSAEWGEAKLMGYYEPGTHKIGLSSDLTEEQVRDALEHEMIHYAQKKFGLLDRYSREYGAGAEDIIERDAAARKQRVSELYRPLRAVA